MPGPRWTHPRWATAAAGLGTLVAVSLLLVGGRGAAAATAQAGAVAHVSGPGAIQHLALRDPGSGRLRRVLVYRPAVPDASTLPVLYFLHGLPGQATDIFDAGLARWLDRSFAAGAAPFIVVAPDGNGRGGDTEWADSAVGGDKLESFVTRVVAPAVEGGHPRDRAHRAIAGFSMGGYGAVNIAEHVPQLFGQAVAIAGYFHVDDPEAVFGGHTGAEAANSPDRNAASLQGTRVLLMDGTSDRQHVVRGESQRFKRTLDAAHVPATLRTAPGGHDWRYVASQFAALEGFLEAGWSSH